MNAKRGGMGMVVCFRIIQGERLIRSALVIALFCLLFICPARADDDALPIIKKAFEATQANEAVARRYAFNERIECRRFNKQGEEKKRESETYEVTLLDSSEYRRLIAINDKPLSEKAAAKEQRKLEKRIKKIQNETPKQREKRLAGIDKDRDEGRKFLEEITKAFDFRLIGEAEIDGVDTYVVSAEPKEGYEPPSRAAKILPKLRGMLWISKHDYAWVKADMETLDDFTWAATFKMSEGTKIGFKQHRINDEVWLTERWYIRLRSKTALIFRFNGVFIGSYSAYRRLAVDSTVSHGAATR
jgi:hypothetical protein